MSATGQSPGTGPADVYKEFIGAVNRQDLEEAGRYVDAARYRENCVGFTHGFVGWEQAKESVRQVWKGLPDLRVDLAQVLADGEVALAHGTVRGTATGRLYGPRPPSARSKPASSTTSRSTTGTSSSGSSKPTCSPRCVSSTARHWAWSGSMPCSCGSEAARNGGSACRHRDRSHGT